MFCEKCGTQIPDGADRLCPRCRAAETPAQSAQPQFQQPQYQQPMMQQPMANFGGINGILANPMLVMLIKLVLGAISFWAAFGPVLKLISVGAYGFGVSVSFMDLNGMAGVMGSSELVGFFVPLLILMILAILIALAGIVLTLLPMVAPQVKLPLPSFASVGATAISLVCSIIGIFITIGFVSTSKGTASLSGFGVFMMILSFLALAGSGFLAYVELKKK